MPGLGDFREGSEKNAALQLQYSYGVDKPGMGGTPESLSDRVTKFNERENPPSKFNKQSDEPRKVNPNLGTIKSETRKRNFEPLRYPNEILDDITDYLQINVIEYKSVANNDPEAAGNKFLGRAGSRRNNGKNIISTIILPIPSNVQDGNSVQYEDSRLNGLTGAVASFASGFTKMDEKQLGSDFMALAKQIGNDVGGAGVAQDLFNKFIVSSAAGVLGGNVSINSLLAREQGIIFNPNMELLFNGPTIRSFRFSFKMTPRNAQEGQEVKKIIREFKRSMAPKVTSSGNAGTNNLFLKTPDVFELTYKQGNGKHQFLNRFKQCALQDISVNYTGEGTYATYDDGTPVSMIMDLTFKELEPIYDTDYIEGEGTGGVGY